MIEDLAEGSLVAEVLMSSEGRLLVVVVEGDLDERFLADWLDGGQCVIVNGRGKGRILGELDDIEGCVASCSVLLDRDLDGIAQPEVTSNIVVYTDRYNLEATLLLSPQCFSLVWKLHAKASDHDLGDLARVVCEDAAQAVGVMRLASIVEDFELKLSGIPTTKFTELGGPGLMTVDRAAAASIAIVRSGGSRLWVNTSRRHKHDRVATIEACGRRLTRAVKKYEKRYIGADVCSGHDVAVALNRLLSAHCHHGTPSATDLEWHAATVFSPEEASGLEMFQSLARIASGMGFSNVVRDSSQ